MKYIIINIFKYFFVLLQIRRNDDVAFVPTPIPTESGHYKSYNDVIASGATPSNEFVPSIINSVRVVSEAQQGCKSTALNRQTARKTVTCRTCSKPRLIYSVTKLSDREHRDLTRLLRTHAGLYECGCILVPEDHPLEGKVFTRVQMSCYTPIETPYYTSTNLSVRKDICCYCGEINCIIEQDTQRKHTTILPICESCVRKGKKQIKRGKISI